MILERQFQKSMSPKPERLARRLQEIQQFVDDRIERDPIFKAVSQELVKLGDTLKQEEVSVQIISENIVLQVATIEDFFYNQLKKLETDEPQERTKLQRGEDRFPKQIDENIKLINNDKANVVKEIRSKVSESVSDLLNRFIHHSIICQLRRYVNNLQAEIVKQEDNRVYIKLVEKHKIINHDSVDEEIKPAPHYRCLSSNDFSWRYQASKWIQLKFKLLAKCFTPCRQKNQLHLKVPKIKIFRETIVDANTALSKYYAHELNKWGAKEWENVCNNYAGGGLSGFYQRSYEKFSSIPSLNLKNSFWQPSSSINVQKILEKSFEKPGCETSYVKISLLSFIFSKVRSHFMQYFTIFFILSILGVGSRRRFGQLITQPIVSAFKYALFPSILISSFVIFFLIKTLFQSYQKYCLSELKKAEDKLKDKVFDFYSGLIEYLISKIRENIFSEIEKEERALDENFQNIKQSLGQANEEAENNQAVSNRRTEERRKQMRELNRELSELQKFKRNLN